MMGDPLFLLVMPTSFVAETHFAIEIFLCTTHSGISSLNDGCGDSINVSAPHSWALKVEGLLLTCY